MVLALDQAFASYQTKIDISVSSAVGGMSPHCPFPLIVLWALPHLLILYQSEQPQNTPYNIILEAKILFPADPVSLPPGHPCLI